MDTATLIIGKVKWFEGSKKFGFIRGGSQDYFMHISDVIGDF
jgi:cold shock CspA family protein